MTRSGRFEYTLGGEVQPLEETFAIDGLSVRSRRRAPAFGVDLAVEAVYLNAGDPAPAAASIALELPQARVTAEYRATDDRMLIRRTVDGRAFEDEVAGPSLFLPLLRIFAGGVVRALGDAGPDGFPVVVPDIRPGTATEDQLAPVVDVRVAERVSDTEGDVTYRFVGGSYESGAEFTVGADGWLRRFDWLQPEVGAWAVERIDD